MENHISSMLLKIPPILLALTFHECAHAWTAMKVGDNTAYMLGRVTLNPLKHLDLMGSLAFIITGMFGWAKPVPVNPYNFRNPTRDDIIVSMAGPAANIILAVFSALVLKLIIVSGMADGLTRTSMLLPFFQMLGYSVMINVVLAVFNMIPIPPLDGSHVLRNLLPPDMAMQYALIERYGFMILIMLMFTGVFSMILDPFLSVTQNLMIWGGI